MEIDHLVIHGRVLLKYLLARLIILKTLEDVCAISLDPIRVI